MLLGNLENNPGKFDSHDAKEVYIFFAILVFYDACLLFTSRFTNTIFLFTCIYWYITGAMHKVIR